MTDTDIELTEAQENESYRRTSLIYFNQYVDGTMIGFTGDEDDLPSDRKMTAKLKEYAATLTPNRLTAFESDGWTLMFKEVVEVEFDYYPHFPMWAQSDLDGVKPHYLPNGCNNDGADVSSTKLKK